MRLNSKNENFKEENKIYHELLKNTTKNSFQDVDNSLLANQLTVFVENKQLMIQNEMKTKLLDELQLNIEASNESLDDLKSHLASLLNKEKYDTLVQLIHVCQSELNSLFLSLFDDSLDINGRKSENLSFIIYSKICEIKTILRANNSTAFESLLEIIVYLNKYTTNQTELKRLHRNWFQLESICKLNEIQSESIKTFLENNYNSILYKTNLFLAIIEPFRNFEKDFVTKVLTEYGNQEMLDINKLIHNDFVVNLLGDEREEFIKSMKFKETDKIIRKTKNLSKLLFMSKSKSVKVVFESDRIEIIVKHEETEKSFKIENSSILESVKEKQNITEFIFNEDLLESLISYLEKELELNLDSLIAENPEHLAKFISDIGQNIIISTSIHLCSKLPNHILSYRQVSTKLFENFYKSLYESLYNNYETLNQNFTFVFSDSLQKQIEISELKTIYIKEHERNSSEAIFEATFYSQKEDRIIENKQFKSGSLFGMSGKLSLEDQVEDEILQSIDYFKYNEATETLAHKCATLFNSKDNQVSVLKNILNLLNDDKIKQLNDFIPEMEQNKFGTKFYFNEYYKMIENLVESLNKITKVLAKFKKSLRQALVERFESVVDELLVSEVKSEILDKIRGNTKISELISCFDGLKFDNLSNLQYDFNELEDNFNQRNDQKGKNSCCAFIKRFIIHNVEKIIDEIIRKREKLTESFNQMETLFASFFSSFTALKNLETYKISLDDQLKKINENGLKNFLNVYLSTINLISEWLTSDKIFVENFKNELYNSRRYLSNVSNYELRLKNLKKLLENYLNPHDITVRNDTNENNVTVIANTKSTLLSKVIRTIVEKIERNLMPGDEIRLINSECLHLDEDLNLPGINVVLVGVEFKLAPGKEDFKINTSGNDGESHSSNQAINGKDAKSSGEDGERGSDGKDGLPGFSAGNLYIMASTFPDPKLLYLSACGGNGSDGQLGGNGGHGKDGTDGVDKTNINCKRALYNDVIGDYYESGWVNYYSGVSWAIGTPGQEGGNGGDSGYSGFGGRLGKCGTITVKSFDQNLTNTKEENGKPGKDAVPENAIPGTAGKHGRDGITKIMTADVIRFYQIDGSSDNNNERIYFYDCHCYDLNNLRKNSGFNTNIKKDKESEHGFVYRHLAHSWHLTENSYPYINPENLGKDDDKLKGKYFFKSKIGTQNKLKSTNTQQSKKINSINVLEVYNECKQVFEKSIKINSSLYQSWQATKICNFLNIFSALLNTGESYEIIESTKTTRTDLSNLFNSSLNRLREEEFEATKSRSIDTQSIGLKEFSLNNANEIDQISKNENELKNFQDLGQNKDKLLENLSSVNTNDQKFINNLKIVLTKPKISLKDASIIVIPKLIEQLKLKSLQSSIETENSNKIEIFILKLKNENFFQQLSIKSSFSNISVYSVEDFIDCFRIIQNDHSFLEEQPRFVLNDDPINMMNEYLKVVSLEDKLQSYFQSHQSKKDEAERITKLICSDLESDDENDGNLLAHKILFADCLDILNISLKSLENVFFNELKRIVNWLNAFYNISNIRNQIKSFSGTFDELKKQILLSLFRDTIQNCFPSLKGCIENANTNHISTELLSIFYNKLLVEYQHCNIRLFNTKENGPTYLNIKADDFKTILDYLNDEALDDQIISDYDLTKVLSTEKLNSWPNVIAEIKLSLMFKNLLKNSNIKLTANRVNECLRILNSFRSILKVDAFRSLLSENDQLLVNETINENDPLEPLYKLLLNLKMNKITFEEALDIKRNKYGDWIIKMNEKMAQNKIFIKSKRTVEEIIKAIKLENIDNPSLNETYLTEAEQNLVKIYKLIDEQEKKIDDLKTNGKQEFKDSLKENSKREKRLCEIISILSCTWYIATNQVPYPPQLAGALFIINSNLKKENLLQEIYTGEGKTLVVALATAYLALNEYKVDVVSSNRDLAIAGENKCQKFFDLLGLTSNHNCHVEEKDRKKSYGCNIVYGEVSSFQGDILDTEFNKNNVCGSRYDDMEKVCLVVDEVDSMCLDKAKDVLYLSHSIETLKWVESLFTNIWLSVLKENLSNNNEEVELQIKEFSECILEGIKNKNIPCPEYLLKYVKSKVKIWTESAFQAKSMQANDEFVIDKSSSDVSGKQENQKKIIVLDKDCGVEQYSSRWSNGLAQFLELKYRRKLSVESLKAVFMSNKKFFELYGQRLYGMTGTLGNYSSKKFLKEIYNTSFIIMPTAFPKKYYTEPPKIATSQNNWLKNLVESVREHSHRPILIITETIQCAEIVISRLKNEGFAHGKIRSYTRDFDEVEKHFDANPATSGDIVIATNKGGRGTDIKVCDANNRNHGGLHVILTYLPNNDRIENQALGRTSRNGNPGSGQFILLIENLEKDLNINLENLDDEEKSVRLEELAPFILQRKKDERDKSSEVLLDELTKTGILHLDMEQKLFDEFKNINDTILRNTESLISKYIEKLNDKYNKNAPVCILQEGEEAMRRFGLLRDSVNSIGGLSELNKVLRVTDMRLLNPHVLIKKFNQEIREKLVDSAFKKEIQEFLMNLIKDYWAFWLDGVQKKINDSDNISVQQELLDQMNQDFKELIEKSKNINDNRKSNITDLLNLTQYPEQQIKLGQIFLRHGQINLAKECFEKAKDHDPLGVAYIGCAYCSIPSENSHERDLEIKKTVRRLLKKAKSKIEDSQRTLSINNLVGSNIFEITKNHKSICQFVSEKDNFYCSQVESKLKVFEAHLLMINKTIGTSLINEYVFADSNKNEKENEKEEKKSKETYHKFVDLGIIYHNRVRREFVDKSSGKLNDEGLNLLKSNFDRSIYDPLIDLLNSNINKNHIEIDKFKAIIRDKNEFWQILKDSSTICEEVQVLDIEKAEQDLPEEFKTAFNELIGKYNLRISILEELPTIEDACMMFGEVMTLFKLSSNNSIFLYHQNANNKWCLNELIDKWNVEKCDQLPTEQNLKSNTVYFTINKDSLNYCYLSNISKTMVTESLSKEISRNILDSSSVNSLSLNELILYYTIGLDNEEPIYTIPYNENLSCQISFIESPFLNEDEPSKIIVDTIKMNSKISILCLDSFNVSENLFNTEKKRKLKSLWKSKELLKKQERIFIKDSFTFINKLKHTLNQISDKKIRDKYQNLSYKDFKSDGLFNYFNEILLEKQTYNIDSLKNYYYSSEVPFEDKEIFSEKLLKSLYEFNLLKSGGLALEKDKGINKSKYAYEQFKELIEEKAPPELKVHVDRIVQLQGEIRSFRDGLKGYLVQFSELSDTLGKDGVTEIPDELYFDSPIGFHRVIVLEENKKYRFNWAALAIFIVGVLQIVAGVALCAIGIENFGAALISEGVSDMIEATIGMITGEFSLVQWAISKAISLVISLVTAGAKAFLAASKKVFNVTKKIIKFTKFQKAILAAAAAGKELVIEGGTALISMLLIDKFMEFIKDKIATSLTSTIKENFIFKSLRKTLTDLFIKKGKNLY